MQYIGSPHSKTHAHTTTMIMTISTVSQSHHISPQASRSGGFNRAPDCSRVMIRHGRCSDPSVRVPDAVSDEWPAVVESASGNCEGCSGSSGAGTTRSWPRFLRSAPVGVSTTYDRGVWAEDTTLPGMVPSSVDTHTSLLSGIGASSWTR